jgi:hypothetical protein
MHAMNLGGASTWTTVRIAASKASWVTIMSFICGGELEGLCIIGVGRGLRVSLVRGTRARTQEGNRPHPSNPRFGTPPPLHAMIPRTQFCPISQTWRPISLVLRFPTEILRFHTSHGCGVPSPRVLMMFSGVSLTKFGPHATTIGWDGRPDPGRPNGLPRWWSHLLTHPMTNRNDATTTENIRFPIPPPKPCASMRAQEDEVKAALGRPPITCGWDPGRPNEPPLLLLHPPHDATATENVRVPILPLNPRAPWRAPEDENNAAPGRLSIAGGWDPGRPNASPPLPPHDATTTENVRVPST